jgi:hypothetical protein
MNLPGECVDLQEMSQGGKVARNTDAAARLRV